MKSDSCVYLWSYSITLFHIGSSEMDGRLETGVKVSPLREFVIAQFQSFTLVNPLMYDVPKRSDTL